MHTHLVVYYYTIQYFVFINLFVLISSEWFLMLFHLSASYISKKS